MTRARLLALPGLLGAALALASPFVATPASADPVIHIDSPATGATLESSSFTVAGHVDADFLGEITTVGYQIRQGGDVVTGDSSSGADYSFAESLSTNGVYTLVVTATQRAPVLGERNFEARRDFSMAAPPPAPSGLTVALSDGKPVLSWAGVSDPDLRGYAIYRKDGGGAFRLYDGTLTNITTYVDAKAPAGALQYRVHAVGDGVVPSSNPNDWLVSGGSNTASVTVPAPPTTAPPPGVSSTTAPPGGNPTERDASNNIDLSDIFSSSAPVLPPVQVSPTPTLPDTGFTPTLPFDEGTTEGKVGGRSPGRPASASADGELTAGDSDGSSTNRRALLVPVAAGSVLCVAALHLRWLNRRLAMPAAGAGGAEGLGAGDLEPADLDPEPVGDDRLPVGAGK